MKIYRVHGEYFAQKQDAISMAIEHSAPSWEDDGMGWSLNDPCEILVFDGGTKKNIINLLNMKSERQHVERIITVSQDMMASELHNKDAEPKTYIKETKLNG